MALQQSVENDLARKFAEGPFTRAQVDAKFGVGQWRPMWRFPILQEHNGKWRAIDDGLDSGHNLSQFDWTRIHATDLVWLASVSRYLNAHIRAQHKEYFLCPMQGGTDDEASAYRWKPVSVESLPFNVVAYRDTKSGSVRFIVLRGHPFG